MQELLSLRGWHVVIVGDEGEHVDRKVFDVKKIHLINVQQQQFGEFVKFIEAIIKTIR